MANEKSEVLELEAFDQHIVIDDHGLYLFNLLLLSNLPVVDLIHENRIEAPVQLEYCLYNFCKSIQKDAGNEKRICFHINLNLFPGISKLDAASTNYYGADICRYIQGLISSDNESRFAIILYSFVSKVDLEQRAPYILPDLHLNNFFQLPVNSFVSKHSAVRLLRKYPDYAVNLLRGWYSSKLSKLPERDSILVVDDEFDEIESIYRSIFGHVYGLNLSKNGFCDDQMISTSLLEASLKNCSLIVLDLYLTEVHGEGTSERFSNRDSISGIRFYQKFIKENQKLNAKPVIFLTTSNKVWNYVAVSGLKAFAGWAVKPNFVFKEDRVSEVLDSYENLLNLISRALSDVSKVSHNIGRSK